MSRQTKKTVFIVLFAAAVATTMTWTKPASAADPFLGQIQMFGFNFAPRGWALCDGQLLAISSYSSSVFLTWHHLWRRRVDDFWAALTCVAVWQYIWVKDPVCQTVDLAAAADRKGLP